MAGGWRVTARMVATAVAAAAVSRAAESVRKVFVEARPSPELDRPAPVTFLEPPAHLTAAAMTFAAPVGEDRIAAQAGSPHEFGPIPVVAPSHGIGFRSEPRHRGPAAEMPFSSSPSGDEPADRDDVAPAAPAMPTSARTAAAFLQDLDEDPEVEPTEAPPVDDELIEPTPAPEKVEPAVVEEPARATDKEPDEAKGQPGYKKKDLAKGKHRRHTSAISGTVQSSRGRGLRGMLITVLDDHQEPIATAFSGTGGAFVVEGLPAGTYRLSASDAAEGDFTTGWHGGASFAKADRIKVKQGRTRRKAGVTLVSAAAIDLDIVVRKKKAVVGIVVSDRATRTPAEGSVRVSTKLFSTQLPLTKGRTAITLLGSAKGTPRLGKKVTIDYSGSKHTRPESAKAKLR